MAATSGMPLLANQSEDSGTVGTAASESRFRRCFDYKEFKDGLQPTDRQKLELCLLNDRAIRSEFEHNSLLWLPIKIDLDGKGQQEWWYPVRVQWKIVTSRLPSFVRWAAGFLSGRHDATKVPLPVPCASGCCGQLLLKVLSESRKVKQHIEEAYEAGGHEVPEWQKEMRGKEELQLQNAKDVEEHIREINKKMALVAAEKIQVMLPKQLDNVSKQQTGRLNYGLEKINTHFGGDVSRINPGDDSELQDCIADVSSALGHSAEKGYKGHGYEEWYLFIHSALYFWFFAVMFCTMLAVSSYALMQFFFMFLLLQKETKPEGLVFASKLTTLGYFCYYMFIPYLLIAVSVVGFQLMLLIRSTVRTPQMSRPRALMIGLLLLILRRCKMYKHLKEKLKDEQLFWSVLKQAAGSVDTWFTVLLDVFMAMGSVAAAIHSILYGYDNYTLTWTWFLLWAAIASIVTICVFVLLRMLTPACSCARSMEDRLEGRMLNWKRGRIFTMLCVIWLGVFVGISNQIVAYEGILFGGVLWAIFTSGFCILAELCLSYKQRDLMTLLEICLDDRAVAPGRMEVRFYEIKNKMLQQFEIGSAEQQTQISEDNTHLPRQTSYEKRLWQVFSLDDEDKSWAPYVTLGCVVLNVILFLCLVWGGADPTFTWIGLLIMDAFVLIVFEKIAHGGSGLVPSGTGLYFFSAHAFWIAPFILNHCFASSYPLTVFVVVVTFVAGMLLQATESLWPPLLVSLFIPAMEHFFPEQGTVTVSSLKAAYPALCLIPVMVYWHTVLVRRMPSLSHGSAKPTIHRRLFSFNGYHVLMVFFSFTSVLLFLAGTVIAQTPTNFEDVDAMGMYVGDSGRVHDDFQPFSYPVCKMRWGPPELNLGVLDLAILSKYAYANDSRTFERAIAKSFGHDKRFDDVHVVEDGGVYDFASIPRLVTTKFVSKSNRSRGGNITTYVVAFKGTSTPVEAFADGSLYSGVAFLGFLSQFVNIFDLTPNNMIAFILNHLRLRPIRRIEDKILANATKWIQTLRSRDKESHIVLTGHSLGGGFASSIAGVTEHEAITFSAPGSHFNRFLFRTNFERAWRNVVNIWPDSDLVPLVDRHDDMVQRISCRDPASGEHPGHVACHVITSTICELWRVCGDPSGRIMRLCTNSSLNYTYYNYPEDTWGKYIAPHHGAIGRRYSNCWNGTAFQSGWFWHWPWQWQWGCD